MVSKFVSGTPNYGFFLRQDDFNGNTNRQYISSEYDSDKTQRPKLEITYESTAILYSSKHISMNRVKVRNMENTLLIDLSFKGGYTVLLTTLSGRKTISFTGNGKKTFSVCKSDINSACYLISIVRDNGSQFTQKIIFTD